MPDVSNHVLKRYTTSVLDSVLQPGIASIAFSGGNYQHELLPHDASITADLAAPLYPPGFKRTVYDRSLYDHHGTLVGATWRRLQSGKWYIYYDGAGDYVDLGSNVTHPELNTVRTMLMWRRMTALGFAYSQNNAQLAFRDNPLGSFIFLYRTGVIFTFDAGTISADIWGFLAVTMILNGDGVGYWDGVEKKRGFTSAAFPAAGGTVYLGQYGTGILRITGGLSYSQRNRTLTPRELVDIFNRDKPMYDR